MKYLYVFVLFCFVVALPGHAAGSKDIRGSQDHPMIGRYPNSVIIAYDARDYDAARLPLGAVSGYGKKLKMARHLDLEGKVTRISYRVLDRTSTLKVLRNYEAALRAAGFKPMFECAADACGKQTSWPSALGQVQLNNVKQATIRYVAAKLVKGAKAVFVAVYVGENARGDVKAGVSIIEPEEMETGLVEIDARSLGEKLAREGKVAIYGVKFDTGKAEPKPESADTLAQIGALLESKPTLKLYVVGHTDDTGDTAHNLDLSRRRATAVVSALVAKYGVAAKRLQPFGAGPYAPVASNASEAGRTENRRVELVQRLR
jgi:outer membrane protein OmpA-like peptidoglycan-associated protein